MDRRRITWFTAAGIFCSFIGAAQSWAKDDESRKTLPVRRDAFELQAIDALEPVEPAAEEDLSSPAESGAREGGEACADAVLIPWPLPDDPDPFSCGAGILNCYRDTGDTGNNVNNYESPNCNDDNAESRDVVYRLRPTTNAIISISMCGTSSTGAGNDDTRLWVYQGDSSVGGNPTACITANEIACNDDAASGCPELPSTDGNRGRQAEIPALAVTANTNYYIVVDGWNGNNGTYTMRVRELDPGACCSVVGADTCVTGVQATSCLCLAQKFTENGSCSPTPSCVGDPLPVGCPPNHIFGPGFDDANSGDTVWIVPADEAFGVTYTDGFWDISQPIKFVSWWGFYYLLSGGITPGSCEKPDHLFRITFYDDDCGQPGEVTAGPFEISAFITQQPGFIMDLFTVQLPVNVSLSEGWVGITSLHDEENPDCRYRITGYFAINSPGETGDRRSISLPFNTLTAGDMMMCLSGPEGPGACCSDQSPVSCTDNVPPASCPPPNRFSEGGTCAALDPLCGRGACCTVDGQCNVTTEAACTGAWKPGVPCQFANCPPSNDNCNLVPVVTTGLPYLFTNRTNGATEDDCPALGAPAGWERFRLADANNSDPDAYSCYDVAVDLCGTSPTFVGDSYDALLLGCCQLQNGVPAVSSSTNARVGTCCRDEPPGYDGNISHVFRGVRSGDWAYPVLSVGGSQGDYTLNVTGAASPALSPFHGDVNGDGLKNLADYEVFQGCMTAPNGTFPSLDCACLIDHDADNDVDLKDYWRFQQQREGCISCSGTAEAEPSCSGVNDGCDSAGAPAFTSLTPLTCGTPRTVCGTSSTDDHDWYQVVVGSNQTLDWNVTAEFPFTITLRDGTLGCDGAILAATDSPACTAASVSFCVVPGTYWMTVAPQEGVEIECGSAYRATLSCTSPCTPTTDRGACCANGGSCTSNVLEATCLASPGHRYLGDGSSCAACGGLAVNDECNAGIVTLSNAAGTHTTPFSRSQLTANLTDPVSGCELSRGGPLPMDGSIWFRYRTPGLVAQNPPRLSLSLCCLDGAPVGADTLISIFRRPQGEDNNPAVACPAIIGAGDGQETACDDDSCLIGSGRSELCLVGDPNMAAFTDYYILIQILDSGQANEQETFVLRHTRTDAFTGAGTSTACASATCPPCGTAVSCPGGAIDEGEADSCSVDHYDYYNSGCNALNNVPPGAEAFNGPTLSCPSATVCGVAGYYNTNGGNPADRRRDTDWYRLFLTEETTVTWTVNSQTDGAHALLIDANDCENSIVLASAADLANNDAAGTCGPQTLTATVPAGRYAVFASFFDSSAGSTNESILCPQPYVGTLSCARGDVLAAPADACASAPVITGAGRYSGLFEGGTWNSPAPDQTPDGQSTCDAELGDPTFCTGPFAQDVYWSYTAPCTGKVSFTVTRGTAPMILSTHSPGCPATCATELPGGFGFSCSSFGGGPASTLPKITLDVESGVTYLIRLASATPGPYEIEVTDCISCCDPLPADNCPVCGNGIVEGAEECDDGNANNGDACDNFCRTNP